MAVSDRDRRLSSVGFALVLLGAALGLPPPAAASCPRSPADDDRGTLTFIIENDRVVNTDRNYTNGFRFSWVSAADDAPDWACRTAQYVPFLLDPGGALHHGFAFGQSIYTPSDTSRRDLVPDDRPYAGWLYVGLILLSDTGPRLAPDVISSLETLELDIGVVGPAALGEQTQNYVHRLIGVDKANGWDNQLRNEPGIALLYEKRWRNWVALGDHDSGDRLGFDAIPHITASLGNVFTYAGAGSVVRLGENLPADYGPPRVRPALPGTPHFRAIDRFGWYFFLGAEGRAVARDIFLDGNTFRDSHDVDKRPLVGEFQAGAAILIGDVRLAYTHIFRTREFEGQDEAHQFGAFSISARF